MTEHAQSILTAAANWNQVVRDLAECGMDPRDITPEWVIAQARKSLHVGVDYYAPEYAGYLWMYEEARR